MGEDITLLRYSWKVLWRVLSQGVSSMAISQGSLEVLCDR